MSVLLAMLLASTCVPTCALADVRSTDEIAGRSVSERALTASQAPDVDARYGEVMTSDGTVLWSRDPEQSSSIASTTKIMTAVVALENADPNTQVTISENAAGVQESSAGLVAGQTTTLHDLLCGMLVVSGNDAATAIAECVGGDVDTFVQMMNDKAAEIGMTNTHFENPHGLEQGDHHSCAHDMALLAQYAMRKQDFRDIVGNPSVTVDLGAGPVTLTSTDEILGTYSGLIGIKTGFTDEAGYCFVGACNRDGLEVYTVVLGASSESGRFSSTESLLDWTYQHYQKISLSDGVSVVANVPAVSWNDRTVAARCETSKTAYALDYDGQLSQSISLVNKKGTIRAGDTLGTVTWTQKGKQLGSVTLVANEDCPGPNILQRAGIWFHRTFGGAKAADLEVVKDAPTIKTYPNNL